MATSRCASNAASEDTSTLFFDESILFGSSSHIPAKESDMHDGQLSLHGLLETRRSGFDESMINSPGLSWTPFFNEGGTTDPLFAKMQGELS